MRPVLPDAHRQRIGVSKGGILNHFPDKPSSVPALVLDIYRRGASTIAAAVEAAGDDARDRLGAYLTFTATHRNEAAALVELASGLRSPEGLRLDEVVAQWMDQPDLGSEETAMLEALDLAARLRRGIERDELRTALGPDATATAPSGAIDAAAAREPDVDPEVYGHALADLADLACRSTS